MLSDCVLILALSAVAQMIHFSAQGGRAVISGDSVQYVTDAEALLYGRDRPHFEIRKPGYALFLAAVGWLLGNMGWAAIAANHALLAALPLAAYALGCRLRSRGVGWVAAFLTIARLQQLVWGDRMMSEALFSFLLSFGLLALIAGGGRGGSTSLLATSGCLLGLAWLTRGTATAVIAAGVVWLLIPASVRSDKNAGAAGYAGDCVRFRTAAHRLSRSLTVAALFRQRGLAAAGVFLAPVVCIALFECGLNAAYSGRFRTCTGTAGAMLMQRVRFFQGTPLPEGTETAQALALLPERAADNAYVAHELDVWIARDRALRDGGMDEWAFDDLMARVAGRAVIQRPNAYLASTAVMAWQHLTRNPNAARCSPVTPDRRAGLIMHPAAPNEEEAVRRWYAYWALPHLPREESIAFVERVQAAAAKRAPFGRGKPWSDARYLLSKPAVATSLRVGQWLGSLWPGFALLGCFWLGLNRRTCGLLAAAYVLEALLVGALATTTNRFQEVWVATDTALAASLVFVVVAAAVRKSRQVVAVRFGGLSRGNRVPISAPVQGAL
ncbi:MAG: glycosyltransferase family 39 protein [Planctomycetes bacterium]|nr:glycosyltransferase family 39 protein [Planctomycetota bacterium]